jgi:hypothetical protein
MENDTEDIFENWFKEVLNGRTEVDSFLKSLNKFDDENFKIKIDGFTSCGSEEDEEEDWEDAELKEYSKADEYPGYYVFLSTNKEYDYLLFMVRLPREGEYPVNVTFNTLNKEREYWFADFNSFSSFITTNITESKEIKAIKEKIIEMVINSK